MRLDSKLAFDLKVFASLISRAPLLGESSMSPAEFMRLMPEESASAALETNNERGPCWFFRSADCLWEYATFIRPSGQGAVTAHLWIYELLHGPIAKGLRVDHLCEIKRCVNPDHLEAVTNAENVKRSKDRRKAERR